MKAPKLGKILVEKIVVAEGQRTVNLGKLSIECDKQASGTRGLALRLLPDAPRGGGGAAGVTPLNMPVSNRCLRSQKPDQPRERKNAENPMDAITANVRRIANAFQVDV